MSVPATHDPQLFSEQFMGIGPMGSFGAPSAPVNYGSGFYGETWGGDGL